MGTQGRECRCAHIFFSFFCIHSDHTEQAMANQATNNDVDDADEEGDDADDDVDDADDMNDDADDMDDDVDDVDDNVDNAAQRMMRTTTWTTMRMMRTMRMTRTMTRMMTR